MRRARVLGGALGLLVACSEPAPPPPPVPAATEGAEVAVPSGPGWTREDDALSARARALAARLEPHGARPDEGTEARVFLAARGTRAIEVEVEAGTCRVLAALASSGMRDLDARLFTPEGELVADDVAPDPQPIVAFCAAEDAPSRVWLVLDAYDGSGSVLVAGLAIPVDAIEAAAAELDRTAGVARAGEARGELERALARRGLDISAPPIDVILAPGQAVRVPLRARAGRCYAIVARPRPPLESASLRLLDLAGAPLVDADPADGALQRCELEDVERAIEVSAPEGGTVDVVIAEGDEARVGGTPGLWLGTLPRDGVDAPARRPSARGSLARGETARHEIRVRRGCVRLRARPTEGAIGRLALEVAGAPRAEARAPSVERCGPAAVLDVRVTALGGAGSYAVEVEPAEPP